MADSVTQKRKDDARELALLLYDMFLEQDNETAKIENGQKNANQSDNE